MTLDTLDKKRHRMSVEPEKRSTLYNWWCAAHARAWREIFEIKIKTKINHVVYELMFIH